MKQVDYIQVYLPLRLISTDLLFHQGSKVCLQMLQHLMVPGHQQAQRGLQSHDWFSLSMLYVLF